LGEALKWQGNLREKVKPPQIRSRKHCALYGIGSKVCIIDVRQSFLRTKKEHMYRHLLE
jgi:hypothetical protein